MHLSPRSRALTKGRVGGEEFVESRLRHLGFPTFEGDEIQGDESDGSVVLEIGYPGLGEDTTEGSAPLVAELVALVCKEMSLGPGKVRGEVLCFLAVVTRRALLLTECLHM
jgi:hypothetical protein